jgi:hypothetical protein
MIASPAQSNVRAVLEDATGRRGRWMRRLGRTLSVLLVAWLFVLLVGGLGLTPIEGVPFSDFLRPSEGPKDLAAPPKPRKPSAKDLLPARPLREPVVTSPSPSEVRSVSEPEPETPVSRGLDARRSTPQPSARRRSAPAQARAAPNRRVTNPPAVKTTPVARPVVRPTVPPASPIANPTPPPPAPPPAPQPATPAATPPGQSASAPGRSGQAPGHTKTPPPATTPTPPPQPETPPGRSATAPGQVKKAATTTTPTTPAPPPPPPAAPEPPPPGPKPPKPPK